MPADHTGTGARAWTLALPCAMIATGAAALVEEIVWARMLHRLLGGTSIAVATVLAGFLGGIAAGGFLAGRFAPRLRRPLAAYGVVEIVAGGAALLFTSVLEGAGPLAAVAAGPAALLALVVLFTAPLGAGFPLLVAFLARELESSARRIPFLYGLNALGGAAGALAAAFAAIPLLGEGRAIEVAAGLQVAAGLALVALARGREASPLAAAPVGPPAAPGPGRAVAVHVLLFASGLAVLYWEVLWTRILVLVVGSSVYALAVVTAGVLTGIGAGSVALSRVRARERGLWALPLALAWLLAAAFFLVPRLPEAYLLGIRALDVAPLALGVLGAGALVLVPAFLTGALFPWGVALAPERCGTLVAVNAAGAAIGAYLGGPLLARVFALESSYSLGVLVVGVLGLCGLAVAGERRRGAASGRVWPPVRRVAVPAALLLPFVVVAAVTGLLGDRAWDPGRLLAGVYQWRDADLADRERTLDALAATREILVLERGREVIVTVERDAEAGTLYVKANGKTEGSVPAAGTDPADSLASLPTQVLLAAYPGLLRQGRPAAVIGLGSGVTVGAARRFGLTPLDVMEIEEAYVAAIRDPAISAAFEPYLDGALESPEVRLHFGDARRLLLGPLRDARWAAIVSQPSEPWFPASAALFTREFFELAASRLEDDGIFVQWLQLYKIGVEELRLVVRTFRRVFGRVLVVRPPESGAVILLGCRRPIELERLLEPLPPPRAEALAGARVGGGDDLLALVLLGPDGVDRWVGGGDGPAGAVNTDARNLLEFRAPLLLHRDIELTRANLHALRELGGGDPVTAYLPSLRSRPELVRRLAARNAHFGDFPEALALLSEDGSREGRELRQAIEEERRRSAGAAPEEGGR